MKIIIENIPNDKEEEVIIRCHRLTPELLNLMARLQPVEPIIAYYNAEIFRLNADDIYYIESFEDKTFIYVKENMYESKQKLYELEKLLSNTECIRVSKSVILNLRKIRSLAPALNGRFEAKLDNGEKIIISRQYVSVLKKKVGI